MYNKEEEIRKAFERYYGCFAEMKKIDEMKYLSFDCKEECRKWYRHEIKAIEDNAYIYDKIMGLKQGGII